MAALGYRVLKPPRRWIADTGSGNDLIGKNDVDEEQAMFARLADYILTLKTAGGAIESEHVIDAKSETFGTVFAPQTP